MWKPQKKNKLTPIILFVVAAIILWCVYFFVPFRIPNHPKVNPLKGRVDIFFVIDDNYAKYMAVTMASILENTNNYLHFYVIHSGLNKETKKKLKQLKKIRDFDISFLKFSEEKFKDLMDTPTSYISKESMMRLYVTDYTDLKSKIIYLDSDTIVLSDISQLYQIDVAGYYFAAVGDPYYKFSAEKPYFNVGIMLINLQKWLTDSITQKFDLLQRQYANMLKHPEQDILNMAATDGIKPLPSNYNVMVNFPYTDQKQKESADNNPFIIHWAGEPKPWYHFDAPKKELFWKYAAVTPFYMELRIQYFKGCLKHLKDLYNNSK